MIRSTGQLLIIDVPWFISSRVPNNIANEAYDTCFPNIY